MTKYEWEREVINHLQVMPKAERERVMAFYDELFEDKHELGESEEQIVNEFGNPIDVARKILSEYYAECGEEVSEDTVAEDSSAENVEAETVADNEADCSNMKKGKKTKPHNVKESAGNMAGSIGNFVREVMTYAMEEVNYGFNVASEKLTNRKAKNKDKRDKKQREQELNVAIDDMTDSINEVVETAVKEEKHRRSKPNWASRLASCIIGLPLMIILYGTALICTLTTAVGIVGGLGCMVYGIIMMARLDVFALLIWIGGGVLAVGAGILAALICGWIWRMAIRFSAYTFRNIFGRGRRGGQTDEEEY